MILGIKVILIKQNSSMKKLSKILIFIFVVFDIYLFGKILLGGKIIAILDPKGFIALQERNLIFIAVSIMLIGVIPVFLFALYVGRKYRATNTKATYAPDWGSNTKLQIFFWAFLIVIMSALSVFTWV